MNPQINNGLMRFGFSAVELLVALTLSSLIIAAILGLVTKLSVDKRRFQEAMPPTEWKQVLRNQLQRDFMHSRALNIKKHSLEFQGYAGIDPFNGKLVHRPTSIEYFLKQGSKHQYLIRKETRIAALPPENVSKTIVAVDVAGFRLLDRLENLNTPGYLRLQIWMLGNTEKPGLTVTLVRHGANQ